MEIIFAVLLMIGGLWVIIKALNKPKKPKKKSTKPLNDDDAETYFYYLDD